jgi:molybdate transport system substrate-binding protein
MQLVRDGMVVGDIQFTYAIGRLVAWFPNVSESTIELPQSQAVRLITNGQRIAYANAALAPYGLAAIQALQALELRDQLQPRLVRGENVGQVYSLVSSGNADIGFVSLAQHLQKTTAGGYWLVGESLHEPIRQDAVLLKRAANNATAKAFIDYLNGPAAQKIIQAAGYAVTN